MIIDIDYNGRLNLGFHVSDLDKIEAIAKRRNDSKVTRGIKSKKFDPKKNEFQAHFEGMKAEYAVSFILDGDLDETIRLGGDKGRGDIRLKDGRMVEVKYRCQRGWDFALSSSRIDDFQSNIGVLVWPSLKEFYLEIVSWISKEKFLQRMNIRDYQYGPRLFILADDMDSIDSLLFSIH